MNLKKMLSVMAAAAVTASCFAAVTTNAAELSDAQKISENTTVWFDAYTENGTVAIASDTVFGDYFFTPRGHTVANNKNEVDGHLNCLRIKNHDSVLAFSVSGAADITVYTETYVDTGKGDRGTVASSTRPSAAYTYDTAKEAIGSGVYAVQEPATSSLTFSISEASDIWLSSYNGDLYLSGVSVTMKSSTVSTVPPVSTEPPVSTVPPVSTATPSPTESPVSTAAPTSTEPPQGPVQSEDWTNLSGDSTTTTVVDGDEGEYIFTYPQGTTGSGFSYDLLANMTNKPDDLSAVTTGKIKVSYDLCIPADNKAGENFFIDLSGNQNIPGYDGGNTATYGRFSGYAPWDNIKFVPGQLATSVAGAHDAGKITYDTYITVTYTADLTNGTFTGTYGENTSGALTGTATEKANALYLNVQPTDKANADNDVVMKIKNITSEYIADPVIEEGVEYVGSSTDADKGVNAYGYKYTYVIKGAEGYDGCNWTVKYNDNAYTPTQQPTFSKVSGEGTIVVTGLVITTGENITIDDPEKAFDVQAELTLSETTEN